MIKTIQRNLLWSLPLALALGAGLSYAQGEHWLTGWLGFSLLFLLAFLTLTLTTRWALGLEETPAPDPRGSALAWMVAIAFGLRLLGGVTTYLVLPINGYSNDEDDRAGFIYTDAHRRDAQAWDLAASDKSLFGAFNQSYAYDQYGGLLSFSAFVYRFLSPDAHRPLMLVLISAFVAALGLPFLWKALARKWSVPLALVAGWLYTLYPESVLLGGSAMREPYLMAFSAFALWGFVHWQSAADARAASRTKLFWLVIGLVGMLLVSPIVALATLIILGGWLYFARAEKSLPWWGIASAGLVFVLGIFLLSSALNRSGDFDSSSPLHVISGWVKLAVQWDVYQLERGSGWVQKLFDEMPEWMRLPFVMLYGTFQPVLPAALVEPTTLVWKVIAILRAVGWYALLPVLLVSFLAAWDLKDTFWLWLCATVWFWVFFTALRGGGDQWDNPRYRTILFLWQALLAARVILWQRETGSPWLGRVILMEAVFVLMFGQWYASRYFHWGAQLSFSAMVAIILVAWAAILFGGVWRDKKRRVS